MKTKIIAEIGINFAYGSTRSHFITNVCNLIDVAKVAGCNYVKFQKRTPQICVPDNKFNQFKDSIKIVHYVGAKPWDPVKSEFESKYQRIEELWQKEFNLISDKKMELNLITTSYSDLNFKRLKGKTMTTNWGIDLELLDIDYYVCSVAEDELIGAINRSKNKVKKWIITDNVLGKIKNISGDRIELFEYMRSCGNLGKIHMHSKKKRGEIDLPTSGVQMLYIASFMPVSKLNIFGINLYTEKDIFGNFKRIGTTKKENPYTMINKPHTLKTDLSFIVDSFSRLLNQGTEINCDSEVLKQVLELVKLGHDYSKILNKINQRK